jgi:hypothetical protein
MAMCIFALRFRIITGALSSSSKFLHVQGPIKNIKAVGDYLIADGPFEGKSEYMKKIQNMKVSCCILSSF